MAFAAVGTSAASVGLDKLAGNGVISWPATVRGRWHSGRTDAGCNRRLRHRPRVRPCGALCIGRDRAGVFFGFINGTSLEFANSAPVALGYALIALLCLGLSRYPAAAVVSAA
jgi:hypothetical protein